ncbi:RhuM family protein [Vallitalea guaymasensis]|uniref:RhuM family protein n=1 Tax=Vallitalea guaymasensis TaxID=1185412 RepID=UPI00235500F4|nr:RhuM family protein [Vallitalea guaymasensis]
MRVVDKLKDLLNFITLNYFDELLERIKDIRASEKRFYKKFTDIYALSIDYNPSSSKAKNSKSRQANSLSYFFV